MGMFDLFRSNKGQSSAFGMIADFLANPQKLKEALIKQLYPHIAEALIKHLDSVELNEREAQAGVILFKNTTTDQLEYVIATVSEDDKIVRYLDGGNLSKKLEELADNIKLG